MIFPAQSTIVVALALCVASAIGGWKVASWKYKAEVKDSVVRAVEQANQLAAQDQEVLVAAAKAETKVKTEFVKIYTKVEQYEVANPNRINCLSADGMLIWNEANKGFSSPSPSSDGTVP